MSEIWSYLGSLYNREGYEITQTVWRWIALFFGPWIILMAGTAIHAGRKKNRLEREAYAALDNGRYLDALRMFAEASGAVRSVLPSLNLSLVSDFKNDTDEAVGDTFFRLGQYSAAVYFYTRHLYRHFGEEFVHISKGVPMPIPVTAFYAKMGFALLRNNCYEEAIIWLRRAAGAEYASDADVWLGLGEAYERIGNLQMAAECKQRAAELSRE